MMKHKLFSFFFLALVTPAWADFIAVGEFRVTTQNYGNVARFNETTNAWQLLASFPSFVGSTASLTRDPVTNLFYTVGGIEAGGVNRLFTVDPNTGQTSLIAPLSQNLAVQALAASPSNGLLYATSSEVWPFRSVGVQRRPVLVRLKV